ncbi:MAG: formate dehydrogenase, partial [Acidimicrobiaceae bacterium]|nr:formate dehydrogenase [Acidimicrobiaceae bacterium]
IICLCGSWGSRFRADISRFNLWTREELKWVRKLGLNPKLEMGKFNPGQKINAIFIGASIVVMFCTGLVLRWFNFFPLSWRTGATFVHDVFAGAIIVMVTGHILFALVHRDSLKSIFTGRISQRWATRHAPRWLSEERPEPIEN